MPHASCAFFVASYSEAPKAFGRTPNAARWKHALPSCAEDSARYSSEKSRSVFFLPPRIRVLIRDARNGTGVVAHLDHSVCISAVWSNIVTFDFAIA